MGKQEREASSSAEEHEWGGQREREARIKQIIERTIEEDRDDAESRVSISFAASGLRPLGHFRLTRRGRTEHFTSYFSAQLLQLITNPITTPQQPQPSNRPPYRTGQALFSRT